MGKSLIPPILIHLTTWLAISYGIYRIFEKAEDVLNASTKKAVTNWLKNLQMPESINNWPQTFAETFDAVFGRKHLAVKCFLRSCLASTLFFVLMFFFWAAFRWQEFGGIDLSAGYLFNAFLVLVILNFVPDYLSLLETRFIIKHMARTQSITRHLLLILCDALVTSFIALVILPLIILSGIYGIFWDAIWVTDRSFFTLLTTYFREVLPLTGKSLFWIPFLPQKPTPFPFFSISFYTAFFTSIWIWLYALSGFAMKLANRFNLTFAFFRKRFELRSKPLTSLGFMAMLIVTLCYAFVPFMAASGGKIDQPVPMDTPALRSAPDTTLALETVQSMLQTKGLYDRILNPRAPGIRNQYKRVELNGQTVVADPATGLMWQQSGSTNFMTFADAQQYISQLNRDQFAGFDDWRLPTVEEAMSLMEPEPADNGLFIDPIFDSRQDWIWTADKYDASLAWVVYFGGGYCYPIVVDNIYFVRAVR